MISRYTFAVISSLLFNLLVMASTVHADLLQPETRVGGVALPYWDTPIKGRIIDIVFADLDGDRQEEIVVGVDTLNGRGGLSILGANGEKLADIESTTPMVALEAIDLDNDGRKDLIVAFNDSISALSTGQFYSGAQVASSIHNLNFDHPLWSNDDLDLTKDANVELVLRRALDPDTIEIYLVANGKIFGWDDQGDIIAPLSGIEWTVGAALSASIDQLFIAQPTGIILRSKNGGSKRIWSHWPTRACVGEKVTAVDTGIAGNLGEIVAVSCESYVDIRDSTGNPLWRYESSSPPIRHAIVVKNDIPTLHVTDQGDPAIIRLVGDTVEEIRYDGNGSSPTSKVGDPNRDGLIEIAVATPGSVRLYGIGTHKLVLGLRTIEDGFVANSIDFPVTATDLDGDDSLDFVRAPLAEQLIEILHGEQQQFLSSGSVIGLQVADIDGGGKQDLVVHSSDGLQILRSFGDADESLEFEATASLPIIVEPTDLFWTVDFDGEGASEIIVQRADGTLIGVAFSGQDSRWKTVFTTVQKFPRVRALRSADLSDDTRPEIVLVTAAPNGDKGSQIHVIDTGDGGVIWQHRTDATYLGVAIDGRSSLERVPLSGSTHAMPHIFLSAPEGWIHVLEGHQLAKPREVDRFAVPGEIVDLILADFDNGNDYLELAVVTEEAIVDIYSFAPDERPRRIFTVSFDAPITSASAEHLDHDVEQELIVTTNDGRGYVIGWTNRMAPFLVNARSSLSDEGEWSYSADAFFPHLERFDVTPVIPHSWDRLFQRTRPVRLATGVYKGGGSYNRVQLTWESVDPFDWWDRGRPANDFSFEVMQDSNMYFVPASASSLRVPGWPWEFKVGFIVTATVLLGMVASLGIRSLQVRRQRWWTSPQGQAEALYEHIKENPAMLLAESGRTTAMTDGAQILTEFYTLLARTEPIAGMSDIVQGYLLIFRGDLQWRSGLQLLESGLRELEQSSVVETDEPLRTTILLSLASQANSVSAIASLRSQINDALETASVRIPGLVDLTWLVPHWSKVVEHMENYQHIPLTEEKIRYLGHGLSLLSRLDRSIRSRPADPSLPMLDEITVRWLNIIDRTLEGLQGQAEIHVTMPSNQVLALEEVSLAVAIDNRGGVDARNAAVRILQSEQYDLIDEQVKHLGAILPTQSVTCEFSLRRLTDAPLAVSFEVTYDDERQANHMIPFDGQVLFVPVSKEYRSILNPYHAGRPLPAGSPLFFGREDIFKYIDKNFDGRDIDNVLVLIGQRRCGKTSLLKQLPRRLDNRYVPVYIDGQQLGIDSGMAHLFFGLAHLISSALVAADIHIELPPLAEFQEAPSHVFEHRFLEEVEKGLKNRRLLLAFDEFEEIEARVRDEYIDGTIFPYFRHLMQHSPKLAFMFVGTRKLEELTKDYWSIFFNIAHYKEIRFLEHGTARSLITSPVADDGLIYDDMAVERILDVTAGHPYFIQLICHSLVNLANNNERNYITTEDVRRVVEETITLGEAHFRWIWDLASQEEHLVLAALSHLLRDQAMVTSSAIASILADRRHNIDQDFHISPTSINKILYRLVNQDIVEEIPSHAPRYRFKLDILNLWIRRKRPLNTVIEQV